MPFFFSRKRLTKVLVTSTLLSVLIIGFIKIKEAPNNDPEYVHTNSREWDILEEWSVPSALAANRFTCRNILRGIDRNLTVDYITLGIGGLVFLVDSLDSAYEYQLELTHNLTQLKDLFANVDLVHTISSLEGVASLQRNVINSFLNKNIFELLRRHGIQSVSLSAPEVMSESLQTLIPSVISEAESSGVQLTGIVPLGSVVQGTKEQAQPLKMINTKRGIKLGILAYCTIQKCESNANEQTHQPALFSKIVPYDIQMLRAKGARLVVVSVNWGEPGDSSASQYSEVVSRLLAMSGADIVVGQHEGGKLGHALYGKTLVIFSGGTMLGRKSKGREFLFYRIRFGRMGDMRSEYKIIDKRVHNAMSEWIEVCSGEDSFCIDCVDLNIHLATP